MRGKAFVPGDLPVKNALYRSFPRTGCHAGEVLSIITVDDTVKNVEAEEKVDGFCWRSGFWVSRRTACQEFSRRHVNREGTMLIVIGGDAAGMSAASQVRRLQPEADITVFERGPYTSFSA